MSVTTRSAASTMTRFHQLLQDQIAHEFAASQQYIALASFYANEDLPQLAKHFYAQSVEERNHAMMIIQYFLDRDIAVAVPGIAEPQSHFSEFREPIKLALHQEQTVTDQIIALARTARDEGDYLGEQFMQWFLKEQVEEVAVMTTLETVAERCNGNTFDLENFVQRELNVAADTDATAPSIAGGAI